MHDTQEAKMYSVSIYDALEEKVIFRQVESPTSNVDDILLAVFKDIFDTEDGSVSIDAEYVKNNPYTFKDMVVVSIIQTDAPNLYNVHEDDETEEEDDGHEFALTGTIDTANPAAAVQLVDRGDAAEGQAVRGHCPFRKVLAVFKSLNPFSGP
jgi:hypothetical protein